MFVEALLYLCEILLSWVKAGVSVNNVPLQTDEAGDCVGAEIGWKAAVELAKLSEDDERSCLDETGFSSQFSSLL